MDKFCRHHGYYATEDDVKRLPAWYSKVGWTCCGRKDRDQPCVTMKPDNLADQKKVKEIQRSLNIDRAILGDAIGTLWERTMTQPSIDAFLVSDPDITLYKVCRYCKKNCCEKCVPYRGVGKNRL